MTRWGELGRILQPKMVWSTPFHLCSNLYIGIRTTRFHRRFSSIRFQTTYPWITLLLTCRTSCNRVWHECATLAISTTLEVGETSPITVTRRVPRRSHHQTRFHDEVRRVEWKRDNTSSFFLFYPFSVLDNYMGYAQRGLSFLTLLCVFFRLFYVILFTVCFLLFFC